MSGRTTPHGHVFRDLEKVFFLHSVEGIFLEQGFKSGVPAVRSRQQIQNGNPSSASASSRETIVSSHVARVLIATSLE